MGRNAPSGNAGWTELFFLDEVTALAAGHRPCFYCRREAALRYQRCMGCGSAPQMDAMLHRQRTTEHLALGATEVGQLPDGAMIGVGDMALAIRDGSALRWTFEGYENPVALPEQASLLTPMASVAALRAGYRPDWHRSASA